ncbi:MULTISPECIES: bifunctional DNA-formamidopyrimidine glycosylase/DNA-(apurinic or apyrimidinic site) lyase [Bacteria]|jgi:formamidopyrimidine-DNA glycosylase|uniref:Formamidopyrimidine-DNA glycosylase n=2 Tax=root TaxID=1 RepID=A0A160U3N1_9ZZZZ|nr:MULTISPECIES: bifunctional DNA-formamidopyrimidine glycosylase/DNA-(apurinic or apyrimidinic site) lyase [Bacteria]MAN90434.1 bifunctional DNA-formamidopyrimidine glycosylase/DNA-(apurinic or apyrimidinic site) lyase [Hyphomonadaceae bacterium]KZR84283.1 Formamidopyrimidine-DNA glycosylase [Synechococcus sp. MIT S9504]MAA81623.1 bifunctional DNA-formamidopyrimidine glycosylase/DNA-(apurinic or apyrimidinic site) lyase [Hyphomonas sp.]MAL43988.1 bifunctional DNA-formamidopyrimidine glycosylas|tara:strand:- start:18802 stop:19647 length:846 start_codon:yes stop_codon:yes gene_type:complete
MPELPEVETVRRGLAPVMEGQRIERLVHNRADLRFPFPDRFAERLSGARITHLGRKAKFLTLALSTDEVLVMHLGMTGRFTVADDKLGAFHHETGTDPRHDHVVFQLESGARVTYNDPRRFGFMELWPAQQFQAYPRLMAMGPEPLSNGFSEAYLNTVLRGRKTPIKSALLDQSVIAGLGNIYVCEALWRAGVSPRRSAATVPGQRAARLVPAINDVIAEAIAAGGSSISDFASASGELGYFQHTFAVYDREGDSCRNCTKPIQRIVQSGRSSFFCSACQR